MVVLKKISSIKNWAIVLIAQFLLFYIFSKLEIVIKLFSFLYDWQKNTHVQIFSKTPFSVGDLFYTFLILLLTYHIYKLIKSKNKKHLKTLLIIVNAFYFSYQCFWGMLYFQEPLISKLNKREVNETEIKKLTLKYLELCKTTREKTSEDKNGVFKIKNINNLKQEIILQQNYIPIIFRTKKNITYTSIKPSLGSMMMDYSGISGYYNPFSAEAQYNKNLPHTIIPFTIAHETAHQLGYAREQEASFIAYLSSENSTNADLTYSTQLYILKSLINSLSKNPKNNPFIESIITNYSEKMKLDRENEIKFYKKNESYLKDILGFTNDLFLKSNQQDGKITYSYFIDLLIAYEL